MAGNPYLWDAATPLNNGGADPDINFAEGQTPGSVNNSARGLMAGIAGWLKDTNGSLTTGGTANTQTVTSNIAYGGLAAGIVLCFKAGATNTGPATLNLTPRGGAAFGAKPMNVFTPSGGEVSLSAGQIKQGGRYIVQYDPLLAGGGGAWIVLNPSSVALPASTTDNTVPRFDGTAGNIQPSGIVIDDSNNVSGVNNLTTTGDTTLGNASADSTTVNGKIMTRPNMPAFLAYNSVTDADMTGDGTKATVDFDAEIYDRGGDFVSDTFTAPVTGVYHFSGVVSLDQIGVSHSTCAIRLETSNRNYLLGFLEPSKVASAGSLNVSWATDADMDAGDTAVVTVQVSGSTKTVDITGGATPLSWFAGHLIG